MIGGGVLATLLAFIFLGLSDVPPLGILALSVLHAGLALPFAFVFGCAAILSLRKRQIYGWRAVGILGLGGAFVGSVLAFVTFAGFKWDIFANLGLIIGLSTGIGMGLAFFIVAQNELTND